MRKFEKTTIGFVVQSYIEGDDGIARCVVQEFIAGDDVTYGDDMGELSDKPNDIDFPFEMKQPHSVCKKCGEQMLLDSMTTDGKDIYWCPRCKGRFICE